LIAQASYYSNQSLSVSFQSLDYLTLYSFALTSLLKRLSIQYVYERVFLLVSRFSFVSQSGCKTTTSFLISKNFLKFFLKLFSRLNSLFFLTNLSRNFPSFAGCKCNIQFQIPQAFCNLF